jgi:hypothetical protein
MKELIVFGIGFVVLGLPFLHFYNEGKTVEKYQQSPELRPAPKPLEPAKPRKEFKLPKVVSIPLVTFAVLLKAVFIVGAFLIVFSIFWNGRSG